MKSRIAAVLLAVLLVPSLLLFQPPADAVQRAIVQSYIIHDPIGIGDNTGFTNASGVVWGSGIQSDPYIIEGWEIDVSDDHAIDGIRIWDTDAYFVVRDVYIHSTVTAANGGISLHSTANAKIVNATLDGLVVGVSCPSFVNDTTVEDCTIRNCSIACAIYDSHNISVVDNSFTDSSADGLQIRNDDNFTARGNSFAANSGNSIDVSYVNDSMVLDNNIVKSSGYGVLVSNCRNVTIQYNEIDSTSQTTNGCCIYVIETISSRVNFNKMTSQGLSGFHRALGISYSSHMQVVGNRIERDDPFGMWHCNNVSVYHNSFVTFLLVYLSNVTNSVWDNGYPDGGNFWSIYQGYDWMSGPDQNISVPDGIGDTPWVVDQVTVDNYPLMTDTLVPNTPPVASFTVSPMWGDTTVNFQLSATSSTDNQTLFNGIQVRWDFDGNGTWDTSWSTNKTTEHRFTDAGNYTVKLEAKDGGGLTAVAGVNLTVNKTGGLVDDVSDLLSDPIVIGAIVAAIAVAATVVVMRRKKGPPEAESKQP